MYFRNSSFGRIGNLLVLILIFFSSCSQQKNPNVVIFYIDDLGYGDVSC